MILYYKISLNVSIEDLSLYQGDVSWFCTQKMPLRREEGDAFCAQKLSDCNDLDGCDRCLAKLRRCDDCDILSTSLRCCHDCNTVLQDYGDVTIVTVVASSDKFIVL